MACVLMMKRMAKRMRNITIAFLKITLICPINYKDRLLATKRT